jgi:SRSO17 transposase
MFILKLLSSDAEQATERFDNFHERFSHKFETKTHNVGLQAKQYIHGQLICQKRNNMVEFEKVVPKSNHQSLQHFVSNSPWDEEGLAEDIALSVSERIGDAEHGSLHIDESGFAKQGKMSVGVARQYCGSLGKVDNCQMGVFLGYSNGHNRILMDRRLYLPKEWIKDKKRRRKCGVPDTVKFQTKAELGLEMIHQARNRGIPYAWIGMDSHYGQQPLLLKKLEADNEIYMADIPCDSRVWLELPKVEIPERKGKRGPFPKKLKLAEGEPSPVEVRKLEKQLPELTWHRVYVRDTERGELWSNMACLRVYPVRESLPGPCSWLILRIDEGENKRKYQLCNAPENTAIERLAEMSHSRYWIERAIQDAKGEAGMDEYQLRGWQGWHRHMTMTFLAMLFLLELHLDWKPKASFLSLKDVREILEVILPKRKFDSNEVIELIKQKHKARYSARRSKRKQKVQILI